MLGHSGKRGVVDGNLIQVESVAGFVEKGAFLGVTFNQACGKVWEKHTDGDGRKSTAGAEIPVFHRLLLQ